MPALQKKHKKSSVHNIKSVMNTRYGTLHQKRYQYFEGNLFATRLLGEYAAPHLRVVIFFALSNANRKRYRPFMSVNIFRRRTKQCINVMCLHLQIIWLSRAIDILPTAMFFLLLILQILQKTFITKSLLRATHIPRLITKHCTA